MAHATKSALSRIAKKNGGVDKFVASALDYDVDELSDYFSAEQVDAIAAAIDNIGNGDGFIIGDQCVAGHLGSTTLRLERSRRSRCLPSARVRSAYLR